MGDKVGEPARRQREGGAVKMPMKCYWFGPQQAVDPRENQKPEDAVMEEADAGEAPVEEEGADDELGEEDPSSFLPSPDGALGASPEGAVVLPSPEGALGDFV